MSRHWSLFLLALLAGSLLATATVHAREAIGVPGLACGGEMHVAGDGDEVPPDADQGVPHHHGTCHGHAFALTADAQAGPTRQHRVAPAVAPRRADLASLSIDPALRPPRA